jgi:hypothetical protein
MSLTNWDAFGKSDSVYETDAEGNRIAAPTPVLERRQFLARYRKSKCPICFNPIFHGDVVTYTPRTNRIRHVTCDRSQLLASSHPANSKEMGRPVLAERPIHTEGNTDVSQQLAR